MHFLIAPHFRVPTPRIPFLAVPVPKTRPKTPSLVCHDTPHQYALRVLAIICYGVKLVPRLKINLIQDIF